MEGIAVGAEFEVSANLDPAVPEDCRLLRGNVEDWRHCVAVLGMPKFGKAIVGFTDNWITEFGGPLAGNSKRGQFRVTSLYAVGFDNDIPYKVEEADAAVTPELQAV